jgi:hypothetical protein
VGWLGALARAARAAGQPAGGWRMLARGAVEHAAAAAAGQCMGFAAHGGGVLCLPPASRQGGLQPGAPPRRRGPPAAAPGGRRRGPRARRSRRAATRGAWRARCRRRRRRRRSHTLGSRRGCGRVGCRNEPRGMWPRHAQAKGWNSQPAASAIAAARGARGAEAHLATPARLSRSLPPPKARKRAARSDGAPLPSPRQTRGARTGAAAWRRGPLCGLQARGGVLQQRVARRGDGPMLVGRSSLVRLCIWPNEAREGLVSGCCSRGLFADTHRVGYTRQTPLHGNAYVLRYYYTVFK